MGKRWESWAWVMVILMGLPAAAGAGEGQGKNSCTRYISPLGVATEVCSGSPAATNASPGAVERVNANVPAQAARNPLLGAGDTGGDDGGDVPLPPRDEM